MVAQTITSQLYCRSNKLSILKCIYFLLAASYDYHSSTIFQMNIHFTICQYAFNIPSAPVIKFQHLFDNPWNMIVDCGQKISFHCFKWSHIRVSKTLSPYELKIIPLLSTKSTPAQKRLRVYGKTEIYLNCFWMG